MTKGNAFVFGSLLIGIACLCLFAGQYLFMVLLGIPGLVCLWIYVDRDQRDKTIVTQARQERETPQYSQPQTLLPPMTSRSRNSRQLFVPPSISSKE